MRVGFANWCHPAQHSALPAEGEPGAANFLCGLCKEHGNFWPLVAKPPSPLAPRSGTSLQYKAQSETPTPHRNLQETPNTPCNSAEGDPAPSLSRHGTAGPRPTSARTALPTRCGALRLLGAAGTSCSHPLCTLLLFQAFINFCT